jgi:hypothetical protein
MKLLKILLEHKIRKKLSKHIEHPPMGEFSKSLHYFAVVLIGSFSLSPTNWDHRLLPDTPPPPPPRVVRQVKII